MTHDKDDDAKAAADDRPGGEQTSRHDAQDESNTDETDADKTKRFERSDNLRRRSEWFQKRTGGR